MSRVVSFVVLVAVLLLIAILFYYVMIPFLLPLFMAMLLVVIFQPLFDWMVAKCGGRVRVAAALTTLSIVLIVLLPIGLIVFQAIAEGTAIYHKAKAAQIAKRACGRGPGRCGRPARRFC